MCGIFGVWGVAAEIASEKIERALASLAHRGPDYASYNRGDGYILGHTRLSIIDPNSRSNQPFFSEDGNCGLVFNGEIYNYIELRVYLTKTYGVSFRTESDTEVLLQGLICEGERFITRLNGMYAFGLVNRKEDTLLLCRDRFGIKPLYYMLERDALFFSSEVKALKPYMDELAINESAVASYLAFRYPLGAESFFRGVYALEPGTYMRCDAQGFKTTRYWLPERKAVVAAQKTEDEIVGAVRERLEHAVHSHMQADVPYGVFLSGGLDSSLIAAMMARFAKEPIRTYSIGFEGEGGNEFEYSREVAKLLDSKHHELEIDKFAFLDATRRLVEIKDAPLAVPNEIAISHLTREMKKEISVVLSGEGADEVFGGYGRIFRFPTMLYLERGMIPYPERNRMLTVKLCYDTFYERFMSKYSYINEPSITNLMGQGPSAYTQGYIHSILQEAADLEVHEAVQYIFKRIHIVGLLHRLDSSTMSYSVEGRVPFLDHEITSLLADLPLAYKIKDHVQPHEWADRNIAHEREISEILDTPKYVLKKVAESYLPRHIVYRKKVGFPVPLDVWKQDRHWLERVMTEIDRSGLYTGTLFRPDVLHRFIQDCLATTGGGLKLWMIYSLAVFVGLYHEQRESRA